MPSAGLPAWMEQLGLVGTGGVVLYLAQAALAWRKQLRSESAEESHTGLAIKQHRDGLTLDLLREARGESAAAWAEVRALRDELTRRDQLLARLPRIELRLAFYDEAISHIEALLRADTEGGREAAEHSARQFLARHEAMKQQLGDVAQAEQVERSADAVSGKIVGRKEGK